MTIWETTEPLAALPSFLFWRASAALQIENLSRKEGDAAMISYSELIQTGIFLVALVGLCYTIFKRT